ncbi:MAG: hypothetical protein AAB446_01300 [Patescibacteria group bacterium]
MINQERKVGTRKLMVFFGSIFVSFVSSVLFVVGIETSGAHFVMLLISILALAVTSQMATKSPLSAIFGAMVGGFVFLVFGVLTESSNSIPWGLTLLFLLAEVVCFILAKNINAPIKEKQSKNDHVKVNTFGI